MGPSRIRRRHTFLPLTGRDQGCLEGCKVSRAVVSDWRGMSVVGRLWVDGPGVPRKYKETCLGGTLMSTCTGARRRGRSPTPKANRGHFARCPRPVTLIGCWNPEKEEAKGPPAARPGGVLMNAGSQSIKDPEHGWPRRGTRQMALQLRRWRGRQCPGRQRQTRDLSCCTDAARDCSAHSGREQA